MSDHLSLWGSADRARVLRGGSFNNEAQNVRCAIRNRNNPENRNDNIGFRVASHDLPAGAQRLPPVFCAGDSLRSAVEGRRSRFPAGFPLLSAWLGSGLETTAKRDRWG